ncbi:carboxypeptidase-like regulatory domain-containing protein [Flavobacterium sp. 3HN19-14]|uniref:carboxypeptidase-like regulatory domain-containing protein n=1 Tax=Flavobacterium sp. 3HN19-14 TaxID=3448133 RepID=UPI003EE087E5
MNSKNKNVVRPQVPTNAPWLLLIVMLLLSVGLYAQDKKLISGVVFDNMGVALPGVSIQESGTTNGTSTDADGKFTLGVTAGNSITASFLGFTTQSVVISATTKSPIEIRLAEDAQQLDEVELVSVGYGTMRRSDLTGSISTVTDKNLVKGVIPSTELVLQGKVAGLAIYRSSGDPSAGGSLRLRGGTSLTANNSPLIVIDGIAGVDINIVQPNDIKSIDVLKDASATAIYGSRGANGVIIITTKKGTAGMNVTYSGFTGVGEASNNLDMLSGDQWRGYVRDNDLADAIDFGGNTDWQKSLQQSAFTQSHTISIASGNELSGLRTSFSYFNSEGVIKTTSLERITANINTYQYALGKILKFDAGINANMDKWHPFELPYFRTLFQPQSDDSG